VYPILGILAEDLEDFFPLVGGFPSTLHDVGLKWGLWDGSILFEIEIQFHFNRKTLSLSIPLKRAKMPIA
jgi:hypothetical protein